MSTATGKKNKTPL